MTASVQSTISALNSNTAQVNAATNSSKSGSTELDSSDFLQLLMTQMKYQDPTNPTDSTQFLQQEAMFTQVSQLEKLNENFSDSSSMLQASSLIGKNVTITNPNDSSSTITGDVNSVTVDSSGSNIVINGTAYPVSYLKSINETTSSTTSTSQTS